MSPTHTYNLAGTYTAILVVSDALGGSDQDTIEIVVTAANNPPVASPTATPNSGTHPLVVEFHANATDPDGDDLTYLWDFGDPDSADNISTLADPGHVYEAPGTYVAWLTVSDVQLDTSVSKNGFFRDRPERKPTNNNCVIIDRPMEMAVIIPT